MASMLLLEISIERFSLETKTRRQAWTTNTGAHPTTPLQVGAAVMFVALQRCLARGAHSSVSAL